MANDNGRPAVCPQAIYSLFYDGPAGGTGLGLSLVVSMTDGSRAWFLSVDRASAARGLLPCLSGPGPGRAPEKIDGIVFRASSEIIWSIDPKRRARCVIAVVRRPSPSSSLVSLWACGRRGQEGDYFGLG